MKRLYLPAIIAALGATALTFGINAEAIGWQRLDAQGATSEQKVRKAISPKQRAAERAGIVNPNAQLVPYVGGYHATPVVSQRPAKVIAKSIENPRGNVYALVPRHNTLLSEKDAFLAKLDLAGLSINPVYYGGEYLGGIGDEYVYTGAAVRNGKLYLPQDSYAIGTGSTYWSVVDLQTGVLEDVINFGNTPYANPYAMTYDDKNDLFYILSMDNETDSQFCIVDPKNNFSLKYVGHLGTGTYMAGIAYNPMEENVYVFDADNGVFTLNTERGTITIAGVLDIDYEFFSPAASGAICYSPMDQMYVAVFRDNTVGVNRLYMIDPSSWEVIELGNLTNGRSDSFIASLVCMDDFAVADAPELPAALDIDFVAPATSGKIGFTVPSMTYYGVKIPATQDIKVVLKSNNTEIYSGTHHAGDKVEKSFTLQEGINELSLTCAIGDNISPARKYSLYIGHDTPKAPADLYFEQNVLTWTAPGNVGENGGYVEPSAITYDVYIDGVKQNSTPLTTNKFTITPPENFKVANITVTATYNGKTSKAGALHTSIGKAYALPFFMVPTNAESQLFTAENSNSDSATWKYATAASDNTVGGLLCELNQFNDNDDWIFLPLINFPKTDNMYELAFDIASSYKSGTTQSLDIAIGTHPSKGGMKSVIYAVDQLPLTTTAEHFTVNFAVQAPGDYYIGIHDRSLKTNNAKGMFLNNFSVKSLDGTSSAVPGNPTAIKINAAPKGANAATIDITLPLKDVTGKALPTNDQITAKVYCGSNSGQATGTPGQTVSVTVNTPTFGVQNFDVVLSNANGSGMRSTHSAYIGIDRPLAPTNIQRVVADDNLSMKLTWDKSAEVGMNGGYVDVDNLTYEIYLRAGVNYTKIGSTKNTWINYETTAPVQQTHIVGPAAVNEAGVSQYSLFIQETLGKPYEIPMVEEFNSTTFSYTPYTFLADNEYKGSRWENEKNPSLYGVGVTGHVQAVIVGYSESGEAVPCKIYFPKATTKGFDEVHLKLRVWDYSLAPNIVVYGRCASNQEEQVVSRTTMLHPITGRWRDIDIKIPEEFLNQGWVQFAVRSELNGNPSQYVIIDSWQLVGNTEYDLKMNEIEGPDQVSVGDQVKYKYTVANAGQLRNSGRLKVTLEQVSGNVVETKYVNIPSINPSGIFEQYLTFNIDGSFADRGEFVMRAVAESDNDEIALNNERTKTIIVKNSQIPTVSLLRGSQDETSGNVTLNWFAPQGKYGDFQDFELETPFENTEAIGDWKNVDFDGFKPASIGSGDILLEWSGSLTPCAWTVIDPSKLTFSTDERMQPHSGKQYIMARAVDSGTDEIYQSSDWLISPEVVGGSTVSFWYNTLASDFTEYVYLWYSNTGTELDPENATTTVNGDFVRLRAYSKVGVDSWELCTYTLPADAKYFALVYSSFDSLAAMIDDISFTPAEMKTWDIDHYSVWRSLNGGELECIADNITARKFVDENVTPDDYVVYYVLTHVNHNGVMLSSPRSNPVTIGTSGVAAVGALEGIYGGKGEIVINGLAGRTLNIYTPDGKLVKSILAGDETQHISAEKGVYVVTSGAHRTKVIVK